VPRAGGIGMDPAVLAFALLLALVTGAAFGLLPALSASRGGLRNAIESGGGRSATEGSGGRNLRRGLVLCEITLAVALLFGAGLLMRSFWRLTHAESGIRPDSVLSLSISIPESVFVAEKDAAYRGALLSSLRALPGVVAAGASKTLPLQGGGEPYGYTVEGRPDLKTAKPEGGAIIVTSGYFAALRIPVVRGRDFTEADFETGRPVLLINRALSRSLWGNADPVGKGLTFGGRMRIEVIGVVGDVRQEGLDRAPLPIVYVPMSLFPRGSLKIFIRSSGDLGALAAAARATIHRLDPDQAISGVAPLSDVVSSTLARPRFLTLLVGVFGAAALLLAAIGIYGVVSYSVSRRTREIGVRVALGADRAAVRRLILGEGMSLAAAGLGLGLLVALALARTLRSVLFETRAHDPATILAVAGLLSLVSLLACAIPAARAARMDPQRALRADE
jgi:putative ABC transport system permease protein